LLSLQLKVQLEVQLELLARQELGVAEKWVVKFLKFLEMGGKIQSWNAESWGIAAIPVASWEIAAILVASWEIAVILALSWEAAAIPEFVMVLATVTLASALHLLLVRR
jgi:hypothetical protein